MNKYADVPRLADEPNVAHAIVEIPSGSRNKFEFHRNEGLIVLDRYLSSSCHYPMDYGFVPQTLGGHGEPLDIMVLVREATFAGCLIEARVLGLLKIRDAGGWDLKVLGVPARDPLFARMRDLADVPAAYLKEVEHFFTTYKALDGARETSFGWQDAKEALSEIRRCHRALRGPARRARRSRPAG